MNHDFTFHAIRATRSNILKAIDGYSEEQLNFIPDGFNNNLIWNAAHVWITQELLCYKLSGLECSMSNDLIQKYRKGSKPETHVSSAEIAMIKDALVSSVDKLEEDFNKGVFTEYKDYTTSYNVTLKSIDDAMFFNTVHEGLHFGSILALRKLV